MFKRIFALLLMLALLAPTLVSCGDSEDDEDTLETSESRESIYATFYGILDELDSEDAEQKKKAEEIKTTIQDAINLKMQNAYKTTLVFSWFSAEEYEAAIDTVYAQFEAEALAKLYMTTYTKAYDSFKKDAEALLSSAALREKEQLERQAQREAEKKAAEEEQARLDRIESGEEEPPEPIQGATLDILYVNGYEQYIRFIDKGYLISLDDYIKLDHKKITDYIHPSLLAAAKVNNKIYGIPVNLDVGATSYMLFNKTVTEALGLTEAVNNVKELADCDSILSQVHIQKQDAVLRQDYPILANLVTMRGSVGLTGFDFLGDVAGFPIAIENSDFDYFASENVSNPYLNDKVVAHFARMAKYREKGYFAGDASNPAFFSIEQLTASELAAIREKGDYIIAELPYSYSKANNSNTLSGFFSISSKSKYAARAMEVISTFFLSEELVDTYYYGVEGEDGTYLRHDNGTVTVLNKLWPTALNRIGNTFLLTPTDEQSLDYKQDAIYNRQNCKSSAFLGFNIAYTPEQQEKLDTFASIAAPYYQAFIEGDSNYVKNLEKLNTELEEAGLSEFIKDVVAPAFEPVANKLIAAANAQKLADQQAAEEEQNKPVEDENDDTAVEESDDEAVNEEN